MISAISPVKGYNPSVPCEPILKNPSSKVALVPTTFAANAPSALTVAVVLFPLNALK